MNRRNFLLNSGKAIFFLGLSGSLASCSRKVQKNVNQNNENIMLKRHGDEPIEKITLTEDEWKERLTSDEFFILRKEGTERPFTSDLNDEKREGVFYCSGCELDLFTSKMKFDSGTGWPSFFTTIENRFETKTDYKLIYPRKEYHCVRCGGHHGHVFKDGPKPTFERWCNNGIALKFNPEKV